jgi:predicted metal-dependent HD superfamily phosphohydrolase
MPTFAQWRDLWTRLGAATPHAHAFDELVARYREPHRRYHTLQHLDECLEKLDELASEAANPEEVELALWFHDAIYDLSRRDNEARSADWARAAVLAAGLPAEIAERVHALVMVTRHHAVPADPDAKIVVDVDLSILGAPAPRFDEYEIQVREEYGLVPDLLYRRTRAGLLREFLARQTIFNTDLFIARCERAARANLERSIAKLAGWSKEAESALASKALYLLMVGSIAGNFLAGWIAKLFGYRRSITLMFVMYLVFMLGAYGVVRGPEAVLWWLPLIGSAQGAFALFTMSLPPLFPTLLRTTGAGFCYNIGRIIAAAGTVVFGLFAQVGTGANAICDHRLALFYSSWLFLPAAVVTWFFLPEPEKDAA